MDNLFFVGMAGDHAIITRNPQTLSKYEAINLMAWLIVLLDVEDDELGLAVNEVRQT